MKHKAIVLLTRLAIAWLRKHSPQSLAWTRPPPKPIDAEAWRRMLSNVDTKGRGR